MSIVFAIKIYFIMLQCIYHKYDETFKICNVCRDENVTCLNVEKSHDTSIFFIL